MKSKPTKQQSGFSVLTLLIAAVAIFGVLTAAVSMSRSGASATGDSQKPVASGLITQGNNFATAFQSATARGISELSVTYGNTVASPGANDLLNPSVSGLAAQAVADQAFATGATSKFWIYRGANLIVTNVGTGAADYAFVVGDLTQAVCQEINKVLLNTTAIPASGIALATAMGTAALPATPFDTVAAGGTITPGAGMQGCVSESGGKYFYYVVVQPQ